jgi:hypothetical protein
VTAAGKSRICGMLRSLSELRYDAVARPSDLGRATVELVAGEPDARFYMNLGAEAIRHHLIWGGFDGLKPHDHLELRCALVRGDIDKAVEMKLGEDPSRVEVVE